MSVFATQAQRCRSPEGTLLTERVLSTGGTYHSVTPIAEMFPIGGALFHPEVHDQICVLVDEPFTAIAHHLEVERTLMFGDCALTLAQFAQVLAFVIRTTKLV